MFEGWATCYDAVYAAKQKDYRQEARQIASWISPARTVLDVACGTGEHLRYLAESHDVAGLDGSASMLAVARPKLPGIALHCANMIAFDLGERFDAVTCLFSSIGYLPDTEALNAAVSCMAKHLAPGGRLVIEPTIPISRLRPPETSTLYFRVGGSEWRRVTSGKHLDGRLEIHFEFWAGDGEVPVFEETQSITLFRPEDYTHALDLAKLNIQHLDGGLTGLGVYIGRPGSPRRAIAVSP